MLIYVASPYSAATEAECLRNVERSMEAGRRLMNRGYVPVMPLLNHWFNLWHTREYGWTVAPETFMRWDFALIRRCDGLLYVAPSPGADRELALATELGLPIWRDIGDVPTATYLDIARTAARP